MKKLRFSLLGAAFTAAAVVSLSPATALADIQTSGDPAPAAEFSGGVIVAHGGEAGVTISYTCHNDSDHPFNHLFVAVKQGPRVNATDRTESSFAKTFYSTNWSADAGPNALACDGIEHQQTLLLQSDPFFPTTAPPLRSGPAFLQICLFDNASGFGPNGPIGGGSIFNYTMQRVLAAGGRS